jgi:Phosphotransferase enzyme family
MIARSGAKCKRLVACSSGRGTSYAAWVSYVKRRGRPEPGSISAVLDSFRAEVRFYREIAPVVGVRVPACYRAEDTDEGTVLTLEDLSGWCAGADPLAASRVLAGMHRQWAGQAQLRWPWLRPVGAAVDLVERLFATVWPRLAVRAELTPAVRRLGEQLVGRVTESEWMTGSAGPLTLVHGDASMLNMRTGPGGEVALLDWEDVSAAPGVVDLAWLLVSSVEPVQWEEVIAAYGPAHGLTQVLPAIAVQGLLSLSDTPAGSGEATAWIRRLDAVVTRL